MNRRKFCLGLGFITTGWLVPGCTSTDRDAAEATDSDEDVAAASDDVDTQPDDDAADEVTADDTVQLPDDFEPFETPQLDVETLQAEFPDGPVNAEAYRNTWVGEVTDEIYIGISLDSQYTGREQGVAVYLCDNEDIGIYLTGELDSDDEAHLTDEDANVELALVDEEFTGTIRLPDHDPVSFTAEEASDSAGLYIAEHETDEVEMTGRWVVLPDGNQRGFVFCCVLVEHPGCIPCGAQN